MQVFIRGGRRYLVAVLYAWLYVWTAMILFSPTFLMDPVPHDSSVFMSTTRTIITFFASALLFKYFLYMFISPWYDVLWARKKQYYPALTIDHIPKVSVIIPAWNEEVGLITTVKSVLNNSYPHIELVVVNDGSTDQSDVLMRRFITAYAKKKSVTKNITYTYVQNGGKGKALNTALALATGEFIVTIDADCIVEKNAIANFVDHFRDPHVMALVGNVKIGNTKTFFGMLQHLEFLFSFYFKKVDSILNTIYIIGGAAGAFRREVFEKIGVYNSHNITEDIDLSVRIQKAGMKIAYASDAIVYTEGATDFSGLIKQRLRWKRGRFDTFKEHSELFFSTKKIHNPLLTWGILPFAIFGDVQLSLEIFFVLLLYCFAFITHDFSQFISAVTIVAFMFFVQMVFDEVKKKDVRIYSLAPIGWLMFYVTTIVEVNALVRSMWGFYRHTEVQWQRWKRVGVIGIPIARER